MTATADVKVSDEQEGDRVPNWCSNVILVQGPTEQVEQFAERAASGGTALSLAALAPVPGDLTGDDLWLWRLKNWGTQWDMDDTEAPSRHTVAGRDGHLMLRYAGTSAWSPPSKAIEAASGRFRDLTFWVVFDESSNQAFGADCYRRGELVAEAGSPEQIRGVFCAEPDGTFLELPVMGESVRDTLIPIAAATASGAATLVSEIVECLGDKLTHQLDPVIAVMVSDGVADGAVLGDAVVDALEDAQDLVTDTTTTKDAVLLHLSAQARVRTAVRDKLWDDWFDALCEDWGVRSQELVPALAAAAPTLTEQGQEQEALAMALAVALNVAPQMVRDHLAGDPVAPALEQVGPLPMLRVFAAMLEVNPDMAVDPYSATEDDDATVVTQTVAGLLGAVSEAQQP